MTAASQGRTRHVPSGTVIFRQGDTGHEMFIIASGRVSLRLGANGGEREVAVLGPGDFFGELSLLADMPRTATAVAAAETTLLSVERDTFALMMQDDLEVVFRMMHAVGRRLAATDRQVQELAGRLGRLRAVGHVLGRCLGAGNGAVSFDAASLAREAQLGAGEAEAIIAELAARGVGRVEGGRWSVDPTAHARLLAEVLGAGQNV